MTLNQKGYNSPAIILPLYVVVAQIDALNKINNSEHVSISVYVDLIEKGHYRLRDLTIIAVDMIMSFNERMNEAN